MIKIAKKKSFNGILVPNFKKWNREKDVNVSQKTCFKAEEAFLSSLSPSAPPRPPRKAGCGLESTLPPLFTARRRQGTGNVSESIRPGPGPGSAGHRQCHPQIQPHAARPVEKSVYMCQFWANIFEVLCICRS